MDENKKKIMVEGLSDSSIERRIYTVRGEHVMIDRDLAYLYGVENRSLRQAVRRNMEKFPDDFLFKLTEVESNDVIISGVSQSVIPPGYNTGGAQMYAFTEQGVAMLSTVLKSANATSVSVAIMRAFVMIRQTVAAWQSTNLKVEQLEHKVDNLSARVDEILHEQNDNNMEIAVQIEAINDALDQLREKPSAPRKRIGYKQKGNDRAGRSGKQQTAEIIKT